MRFVDTNIFVRFLTNDDPAKGQASYALFEQANRGETELTTSESVLSEVVYVLSSSKIYGRTREQVRSSLYPLIAIQNLRISHRSSFFRALDIYATSKLDFEDALTIAHIERQNLTELVSYDQGFDRVIGDNIRRTEP